MEIELRKRARYALEKAINAFTEIGAGSDLPPHAEEALKNCREVLGGFDFLKSTSPIFPKAWEWEKYEGAFRELAYQAAGRLKQEKEKDPDDQIFYPDLVEDFVLEKQDEGQLPSNEKMQEKGEALIKIQDHLEGLAEQEIKWEDKKG